MSFLPRQLWRMCCFHRFDCQSAQCEAICTSAMGMTSVFFLCRTWLLASSLPLKAWLEEVRMLLQMSLGKYWKYTCPVLQVSNFSALALNSKFLNKKNFSRRCSYSPLDAGWLQLARECGRVVRLKLWTSLAKLWLLVLSTASRNPCSPPQVSSFLLQWKDLCKSSETALPDHFPLATSLFEPWREFLGYHSKFFVGEVLSSFFFWQSHGILIWGAVWCF